MLSTIKKKTRRNITNMVVYKIFCEYNTYLPNLPTPRYCTRTGFTRAQWATGPFKDVPIRFHICRDSSLSSLMNYVRVYKITLSRTIILSPPTDKVIGTIGLNANNSYCHFLHRVRSFYISVRDDAIPRSLFVRLWQQYFFSILSKKCKYVFDARGIC